MTSDASTLGQRQCERCGAALPLQTPPGQCLACLLRLGFKAGIALEPEVDDELAADAEEGSWPRLADYRVLRELGQGGSALVYAAEQLRPVRREVAVKVIKPGMDTRSVMRRFASEKQVLAVMDHPNIAKVYDAGTTDSGRAYFVMELVPGIPLTDYCDWRLLSLERRIELFLGVCGAVQHAHQKGIIHRDLKPTNILVATRDDAPTPRIIDFGIAKATGQERWTGNTLFTAFELAVGTPAYMSPEQAALGGVDIDTRSDIYSLGVVLHELLAGCLPFDGLTGTGLDEWRRRIREEQPRRLSVRFASLAAPEQKVLARRRGIEPSRLTQVLRGDLDWIVLKALEKDRALRFSSVAELAGDLRRYLNSEPIHARPPSALYQFRRFARRNKGALAAAAVIAIAISAAAVLSTIQAVRARQAEQRALIEAGKSEEVAQFLENMLLSAQPAIARGEDTTLLRRVLAHTSARIGDGLSGSPESQARLRQVIGWTYFKLGDQGQAEQNLREAVRLYRSRPLESVGLAGSLNQLAQAVWPRDQEEAERMAREALLLQTSLRATPGLPARQGLAVHGSALAKMLILQKRWNEARSISEMWLEYQRRTLGESHSAVAWTLTSLGQIASGQKDLQKAEHYHREALRVRMQLHGEDDLDTSNSLRQLASTLSDQQKLTEAEPMARRALDIDRRFLGDGYPEMILPLMLLGDIQTKRGEFAEAESLLREALRVAAKSTEGRRFTLSNAIDRLADDLRSGGDTARADALERDARAVLRQIASPSTQPVPSEE